MPATRLTLEFAGVWRQYHACLMRTLTVGAPDSAAARQLFDVAGETLLACEDALRPGRTVGDVYAPTPARWTPPAFAMRG